MDILKTLPNSGYVHSKPCRPEAQFRGIDRRTKAAGRVGPGGFVGYGSCYDRSLGESASRGLGTFNSCSGSDSHWANRLSTSICACGCSLVKRESSVMRLASLGAALDPSHPAASAGNPKRKRGGVGRSVASENWRSRFPRLRFGLRSLGRHRSNTLAWRPGGSRSSTAQPLVCQRSPDGIRRLEIDATAGIAAHESTSIGICCQAEDHVIKHPSPRGDSLTRHVKDTRHDDTFLAPPSSAGGSGVAMR